MTLPEFTAVEEAILAKAGDLEVTRKRIRAVWGWAALVAVALFGFGFAFHDWRIVTGVAVVYILINTAERAAYGRAVLSYKSVIQKLLSQSTGQIGTDRAPTSQSPVPESLRRSSMSAQEARAAASEANGTILAGGIALIGGAVAFLGVFSYLAARFRYPEVLEGTAQTVLPALLATGAAGRAVWALYGVLPLVFVLAGVSAFEALRLRAAGPTRAGMLFALLAAVSMVLGLMRWPSVHWELAQAWVVAGEGERLVLSALFDGLNRYLGNFIGEFLGELGFSVFFLLSGVGLLRHQRSPKWLGWWGIITGVLGLIGMWRNVTPAVDTVAAANNYLLPAWMVGFGVWLVIAARRNRPWQRLEDGP